MSSLFQYTSSTPVVSLHLIPRIQYHPGIPVTLLTGSNSLVESFKRFYELYESEVGYENCDLIVLSVVFALSADDAYI